MSPKHATAESRRDYRRTCFVAMPYGIRDLAGRAVDFDRIYKEIFKPAIRNVRVDGKTPLLPLRSDETVSSRLIIHRMLQDLLASRLVLADLTTRNPNVFYELSFRHALVPSGTVAIRMKGEESPFDVASVSVSEYQHEPEAAARVSRSGISKVLRETLRWNEVDSPSYAVVRDHLQRMGTPEQPTAFGKAVIAAEEAALHADIGQATQLYRQAALLEPDAALLHERQSHLLWLDGRPDEAMVELRRAVALRPPVTDMDALLGELDPSRFLESRFGRLRVLGKRDVRIDSDLVRSLEKISPDQAYTKFLPEHDAVLDPTALKKHPFGASVEKEATKGLKGLGKLGHGPNIKGGGFGGSGGGFGGSGGGFGGSGGGFTP